MENFKDEEKLNNNGETSSLRFKDEDNNKKNIVRKSIAKNSFFYLIYNVLNIAFPFITGIYVARVMLPETVGVVSYAQNIVQYFVILAFLGIPTYGLREISKVRFEKDKLNKLYSELVVINTISTFVFLSIYLGLIFIVPSFYVKIKLYLIVGILIALNFLNISWLYEGLEEFGFISIRNIVFKAVSFIFLIIMVKNDDDIYWYALVTVIGTAGNYLLNIIGAHKYAHFTFNGLNIKRHLKSIFYLIAVNLAIEIYALVDITMLGIFCDDKIVAYYKYGNNIYKILLQVMNTFTMVIVPRIALYYKEKNYKEYNKLLSSTLNMIIFLALPMIVGLFFVSHYAIDLLYTSTYSNSADVLRILSVSLLISPIGYLLGSRVCLVTGNEKKMIIAVASGALLNVLGNFFLIQVMNEYGAALSSVLCELVVMVVYLCLGHKYFSLNKSIIKDSIKCFVSTMLMFGVLFLINTYIDMNYIVLMIIEIISGIFIYFISLILLKENMIYDLIKKIERKFGK